MATNSAARKSKTQSRALRYRKGSPKKTFDLQKMVNQKSELQTEIFETEFENLVSFDRATTQNLTKKELLVVVIPAYTKEDRLDVALQSLIDQTVPLDWILILLNGPEPKNGKLSKGCCELLELQLNGPEPKNGKLSPAEKQAREFQEGRKYSAAERSFLYSQRAEFAMKTVKQQTRRRT